MDDAEGDILDGFDDEDFSGYWDDDEDCDKDDDEDEIYDISEVEDRMIAEAEARWCDDRDELDIDEDELLCSHGTHAWEIVEEYSDVGLERWRCEICGHTILVAF